jgi:hypothetical protein
MVGACRQVLVNGFSIAPSYMARVKDLGGILYVDLAIATLKHPMSLNRRRQ